MADRKARQTKRRPDLDTLYSINEDGSRNHIHPADVKGRWQRRKNVIFPLLTAVLVLLPWIEIGGNPAVFFDIPGRAAYIFGGTFTNQDFYLVFFLVSGLGFALFVLTSLWGRVWCGFLCPQTVFMEGFFRRIERWIEGPRNRRIRRNQGPMTLEKFARKALKQVIFILLAAAIAHVILSYFIPVRELMALMREGPREHMTAFLWALFGTLVTYFNFAWFREQTCLIVCPYGRLQSALIDDSTIIIGYDETRGEPRHKRKDEGGDCIDCFRCVEVCPTGIDIRNGLQLECIGCANCIDACDDVMEKMGKPRGLVRYDSLEGLSGRRRRFLRPRVYIYAVAGLVGLAVATGAIANRAPFQVNALRAPGTPFVLEEASIRNVYNLHLQNKTTEARSYRIERQPAPAGYDANVSLIIPQAEVRVGGLSDALVPIIAAAPREDYRGPFDLVFVVTELGSGYDREVRVRFRGP